MFDYVIWFKGNPITIYGSSNDSIEILFMAQNRTLMFATLLMKLHGWYSPDVFK